MERSRLIVNFDSSGDKLLSTENVVACGETFDILFRDVTLSGTVRVAFWDYETLLWRSEGSASQGDGGSVLEGLVADTKELADVFRGGSGFFAARLTVGEQVGGDEWRDYGIAYVRLYRGTDPSENPPPARPDVYPTEEELNAWLEAAGEVREGVCTCARAAASSAEAAASSARLASAQALDAVKAASAASASAKAASVSAEQAASEGVSAAKSAQAAASSATAASQSAVRAGVALEDAQTARGDAQAARDAAKASETAAARSAKDAAASATQAADSKAAAAGSASAAAASATAAQEAKVGAESAKTEAETAKTQAEAARDNANTAKTSAEKAKQDAEAAKAAAATSATNAAQSAEAAETSATKAEEAAEGLKEGLATLDGLDGRVTFLETGEGVYKDPVTGKVITYKPLPGSDGTVKITKELPQFYKILPVEEDYATSRENIAVSDGVYYVFYCGVYNACRIYFYSSGMKRLGKIPNSGRDLYLRDSGRIALFTAADGHLRASGTYTSIYKNSSAMLWDVTAGELLKIVGIEAINADNDGMDTIYNPASGHILTREAAVKREDDATRYDFSFLVWDEDLNPVLDEATGVQKRIDANGVFYDNSYPAQERVGKLYRRRPVRVFQAPFDNKVYFTSTNYRGANNAGLFTFGADDTPIQIMEHIPVEDPDNPGYCLCERNEDGSLKREWTDRGCYFPRLVTQEVGPALFMRTYPEEYGLKAGGYGNGVSGPAFLCSMTGYNPTVKEYKSCFRDLAFRYIVTPDNKLINTVFFNNEFLTETKAPRYTYRMPIPNAATIGNKPWPGSPDHAMLIPSGYEATAMMFPYAKDETRMIAVKGTVDYDNATPFNPVDVQKYPLCPVAINTSKASRSASPNKDDAYVVFGEPMWCTNYILAYAGAL